MPLEINRIKALCFDIDGTLNDTDDLWAQRLGRVLRPFRTLLPGRDAARFARMWIMAAETPANALYRLADQLQIDDDLLRFLSKLPRNNRKRTARHLILPGVVDTLTRLRKIFPMAVVSANLESSTMEFLDQFGLKSLFTTIVTSQTCQYTKPYPDPVIWAANQMGIPAENCLMIGDTTVDIKSGKRAGGQAVGVLCGFGNQKELLKAGADAILETTTQIDTLLLEGQSK